MRLAGPAASRLPGLAAVAGCALLAASLLLPFILWQNAWSEWGNALWLVEHQAESIRRVGHPSYYLHLVETGAFYPQFLFYGGSLFAVLGGLAVVFGSAWAAFVAVLVVASAAAFGGMLWLGRQAGLSLPLACLPALVVLTSPYAVLNLYGRGAFAEIVAVSAIPLALAGLLSILRADRPWLGACALAAAVAAVAGSHNITLVWGSLVLAALVAAAAWAVGRDGLRAVGLRRAIAACGAILLGVALVAWSLIPAAAYGRDTRVYADKRVHLAALPEIDQLDVVFHPLLYAPPSIDDPDPRSYLPVPVYVLAWIVAAVAAVTFAGRARRVDLRLALGLAAVAVVLVTLLVANPIWDRMPGILAAIQFAFRLHAYVVVVVALMAVVALRMLDGQRRRAVWVTALVAALAVQAGLAEYTAWSARTFIGREEIQRETVPASFPTYQRQMYLLDAGALPRSPPTPLAPTSSSFDGDRLALEGITPGAARYGTQIVASEVVRVRSPWRAVGHDPQGFLVLSPPPGGATRAVVEPAAPWPVAVGTSLSLAALALAVVGGGFVVGRRALRSVQR
jgi:hypothetical protein